MALRTVGSWLYEGLGLLAETGIRQWIRLCGRRLAKAEVPWLDSPTGPRGRIGDEFFRHMAEQRGLTIRTAGADVGLVPDFDVLRGPDFDPRRVRPEVRHFYEHTARYDLEAWSQASVLTRPFLWLLVTFVSRRMDQFNFPVSPLETSRGMTSELLTLADASTGAIAYTGWLRKLAGTGRVIYAGFYSVGRPDGYPGQCVKVSFPLPLGSATVFLHPEAGEHGSFRLVSAGARFGDPGFYRVVEADAEHWRVRYLKTLQEVFHVWVDEAGTLRTDHTVRFLGMTVLRLHYKLTQTRG